MARLLAVIRCCRAPAIAGALSLGAVLACSDSAGPKCILSGITLSSTSVSIGVGETTTLTASVVQTGCNGAGVTWISSAGTIASVSNGVVTGVAPGTAVVTATATTESGSAVASAQVTVRSPPSVAFAFVFANDPAAQTYQPPGFNGFIDQSNRIVRLGTGSYRVTFNGIGKNLAPSYTVTLSAVAPSDNAGLAQAPPYCSGADLSIGAASTVLDVACTDPRTGAAADARFRAMLVGANVLGGPAADGQVAAFTAHTNLSILNGTLVPDPSFAWNSAGAPMSIMKFPSAPEVRHDMGVIFPGELGRLTVSWIVTAFGANNACSVDFTNFITTVFCFDRSTGGPRNAMHTILATAGPRPKRLGAAVQVTPNGAMTPVVFTAFTTGGTPTAVRASAGRYTVTFPGVSPSGEVAVAVATRLNKDEWHTCTHFVSSTSPLTVDVACFNRQGVLSESLGFGLLILQ